MAEKPIILVDGEYNKTDLEKVKNQKNWQFKDIYEDQLRELFEMLNPSLKNTGEYDQKLAEFIKDKTSPDKELRGNYVYYPWSGLLLHMVAEEDLVTLRTNRTQKLITREEQTKIGQFSAGIAGLSFGNGIALSLVYTGFSNTIKIADRDIFETSNLNRVRVGIPSFGELKTAVTAREIYEINPYANVVIFDEGLNDENIKQFVNDPKLNIIFDVVDDFAMKIKLRLEAKKAKIPVVMLTSLEDSILVDVERFDIDSSAEIFHGILGNITDEILGKEIKEEEMVKYAMAIVGPEHISYRNLLSLSEIGKSLVSRPHLYGTVSIVCGLASYIAKRISLEEDMPSMRTLLSFNEILGILPNKEDTKEARNEMLQKLMKGAGG